MKRSYYAVLIVAVLGITLMTASVRAQDPQYKEGDRVEINLVPGPDPTRGVWKKGTVVTVDARPTVRAYVVQLDPLPGKVPQVMTIPIPKSNPEGFIRPFGGAAPQVMTEKLRVDDNGTVLADRELLDCENLKRSGRNGSPPPVELAKKLIRCLYEKPSKAGMDGATTMDISALTIGAPHHWTVYVDMGQGNASTLVYPAQVKWTMKTFYRRTNVLTTDKEGPFTCFADATNVWQCGSSTGSRKDGKIQEIVVKP
jgi:hypothetical protein